MAGQPEGSKNADLVRALYEAWRAGDVETALAGVAPDLELEEPLDNPDGGKWQGREGLLGAMGQWTEPFAEFDFEIVEVEEAKDQVLIYLKQWARGRSSGAMVESKIWHLWTMRDGLGVRMQMFLSRPEALSAAGW